MYTGILESIWQHFVLLLTYKLFLVGGVKNIISEFPVMFYVGKEHVALLTE